MISLKIQGLFIIDTNLPFSVKLENWVGTCYIAKWNIRI